MRYSQAHCLATAGLTTGPWVGTCTLPFRLQLAEVMEQLSAKNSAAPWQLAFHNNVHQMQYLAFVMGEAEGGLGWAVALL
jgi:hypothetical protein